MALKLGRITSVFVDDGNCTVNVQLLRKGQEERDIPLIKPLSGITFVPDEGDLLAMDTLNEGQIVGVGILNQSEYDQPEHDTDEFSFVFDEETELKFQKNEEGKYDIDISCSGDVNIQSDSVTVGSGTETPVVDVQTTTSDGYVTSVEVENSSNLSVE